MTLNAFLLAAVLFVQEAGRQIDQWIRDLAAESYETREKAESQLLKIGRPALPALKGALLDKDAERAHRARRILSDIENNDRPSGRTEVRMAGPDLMRGITFETYPDGRVQVTVREENRKTGKKDYRSYTAASIQEFKLNHPQVAREYDLDKWMPQPPSTGSENNRVDESWDEWQKRFDRDWFWDQGVGKFLKPWMPFPPGLFGRWFDHRFEGLEQLLKRVSQTGKDGGQIGVLAAPVPEALASQLGLEVGVGILVEQVLPESRAEQAGLQKHDVLLKVSDQLITSLDQFRKSLGALKGKSLELEIVRKGKARTISVEPAERE